MTSSHGSLAGLEVLEWIYVFICLLLLLVMQIPFTTKVLGHAGTSVHSISRRNVKRSSLLQKLKIIPAEQF